MNFYFRQMSAMVFLGATILGLVPLGCVSRLGPVTALEQGTHELPNLPDITVDHVKECMAEYGQQFEPGQHSLKATILVDEDGHKNGVTIEDLPETAHDFGACMRIAFDNMVIREDYLQDARRQLREQRATSAEQRKFVGNPIVIVVAGVTIVVSELALEAGLYTVMVGVTIKVVEKAADDVAELAKKGFKKCVTLYTGCMATGLSNPLKGNHWSASHCNGCFERCQTDGEWPAEVGGKTCRYW